MPVSRAMLQTELKALQRLTAFEQAVATVRRTQAASSPIGQELADNARKAQERLGLLASAVRSTGGTPDLVGTLLGRAAALVQAQVNQVQTLQDALLGDLALEHQLRDRARYARTLAVSLGETAVVPVLDRLEAAHGETIAWLQARLDEVGRTGTSAIQQTPVQAYVGQVRRVTGAPLALAALGINRVGGLVQRLGGRAPAALGAAADTVGSAADTVADAAGTAVDRVASTTEAAADRLASAASDAADRAEQSAAAVAETVSSGADSAAATASSVASAASDTVAAAADTAAAGVQSLSDDAAEVVSSASQAADQVADAASGAAADGAGQTIDLTEQQPEADGDKPPFAGYERLSGDSIMRHVDDTEDVEELRVLQAFEQAHKARKGVLGAVDRRLSELTASAS